MIRRSFTWSRRISCNMITRSQSWSRVSSCNSSRKNTTRTSLKTRTTRSLKTRCAVEDQTLPRLRSDLCSVLLPPWHAARCTRPASRDFQRVRLPHPFLHPFDVLGAVHVSFIGPGPTEQAERVRTIFSVAVLHAKWSLPIQPRCVSHLLGVHASVHG